MVREGETWATLDSFKIAWGRLKARKGWGRHLSHLSTSLLLSKQGALVAGHDAIDVPCQGPAM